MFVLPSRSGNENSTYNWSTKTTETLQIDSGAPTFLSNRPGLMRAGSSVSGLFVAINTCDRNVNFGIVVSTKEEGQLHHLDVATRIEAVQLVDQLQHGSLNLSGKLGSGCDRLKIKWVNPVSNWID